MRRLELVWCLTLLVLSSQHAAGQAIDLDRALAHYEFFRSTYPRLEATTQERRALSYIDDQLRRLGLDARRLEFAGFDGGHSFSSVLVTTVAGSLEDEALIMVPINHPEDAGATADGSAQLAVALALLEELSKEPHELTVTVAFLGAEFGNEPRYPMGTDLFLEEFARGQRSFGVYVSPADLSGALVLDTGGGGIVSPPWLVDSAVRAAEVSRLRVDVPDSLNQLHRLGLSDGSAPLVPYLEAEIPALMLRSGPGDGGSGPSTSADPRRTQLAPLSALLSLILDAHSGGIPPQWDRHYVYIKLLGAEFVVGEEVYLQVLLVVFLASLLYALLFRRQLSRYLRTILRNLWNLPVLFLLIFALLLAGTYLINLFLLARGFPTLWEFRPVAYVGLKVAVALFVFLALAQLLRRLPLSKNGSFYSAASIFVLFADVIIFGVLDISYSFYFLWAFACAFLFSVFRARWLKALMLIASPLWLIKAAFDVLQARELGFTRLLLQSPVGNLMLSFIMLPFLLMIVRLDFLFRHPVRGKRSITLRIATALSGAVAAAAVLLVLQTSPYDASALQPITITERIDYEQFSRDLIVQSPAPLGDLDVTFARREYTISTHSRRWQTGTDRLPDVLSVRVVTEDFLDRDRSTLRISSEEPIEEVSVRFSNDLPMLIYDINYPFTLSDDRTSATIHIGTRPGSTVEIGYTLARGTYPRIDIDVTTNQHPEPVIVQGTRADVRSRVELHTSIRP